MKSRSDARKCSAGAHQVKLELGNFVLIDHGNGEFSIFPHIRLGSLRVKVDDHIRQGQILGEVGFSGDAIFPHVHCALLWGPDSTGTKVCRHTLIR